MVARVPIYLLFGGSHRAEEARAVTVQASHPSWLDKPHMDEYLFI